MPLTFPVYFLPVLQQPFNMVTLHYMFLHFMSIQYILEPIIVAVGKT